MNQEKQREVYQKMLKKCPDKAEYNSPFGKIKTKWERHGDKIEIIVSAPREMQGNIILPDGYCFTEGDFGKALDCDCEKKYECMKM